jgi:hypothetical protein
MSGMVEGSKDIDTELVGRLHKVFVWVQMPNKYFKPNKNTKNYLHKKVTAKLK